MADSNSTSTTEAFEILGRRVIELEGQLERCRAANDKYREENADYLRRIERINVVLDQSLDNTREALSLITHMQATTDINSEKLRNVGILNALQGKKK